MSKKYSYETKMKVIKAKIENPKASLSSLCILYGIDSPDTVRYWLKKYEKGGYEGLRDKRHRQKGAKGKKLNKTVGKCTEKELIHISSFSTSCQDAFTSS